MELRWAGPQDAELVVTALLGAVNWDAPHRPLTREALQGNARLTGYLVDFTDDRAFGVVGVVDERPIALAWAVLFSAEAPGYGFVSPQAPEVALWVHPEHRRQGHGRTLLGSLVAEARRRGLAGLSLSVDEFNPALELYLRAGFRSVGSSGSSQTMLLTLG